MLKSTSVKVERLRACFAVVKYIIDVKLAEAEANQKAKVNAERRRVLQEALINRQAAATAAMTEEQIKAELASLGA